MAGYDQAQRLRDAIIKRDTIERQQMDVDESLLQSHTRVICVSSGKGGVGKSNFAVNLSLAMTKQGKSVVVIDADLGLANIEILLGIIPRYSLLDLLEDKLSIEDIMVNGPGGLKIISGGSGLHTMAELSMFELNKILNAISELKNMVDYIIIDTGAGISKSVTAFIEASNELIIVTTPEPPSIADAYALIKIISYGSADKMISLVINRAANWNEGESVFQKIQTIARKFLNQELNFLGAILNDDLVSKAVKEQQPFYLAYPKSKAATSIDVILPKIMEMQVNEKGFFIFMKKLKNIFGTGGSYGR